MTGADPGGSAGPDVAAVADGGDRTTAPGMPGTPAPERPARSRDQYIDGLRALALVRVMTYHTFGWPWLPVAFPSMGVMFALGGSLVAASLARAPGDHWRVLARRVRRLLPPLWLYGAVLVTVMAVHGWTVTEDSGSTLTWSSALHWVIPLVDPPGSAWGYDFVLPLWYIRTYLWLLLISPMLVWLFRRYPVWCLVAPFAVLLYIQSGALDINTDTGDTIEHLATFGTCWLLGFAHHDGLIRRLPRGRTVVVAVLAMAAGLAYALARPAPDTGWDIDNLDVPNAVYSAGAVLLLLRLYPRHTFLERMPRMSRLVSAMNARAMTIYLWGNFCIWASTPLIESNGLTIRLESSPWIDQTAQYAVAWLVMVAVVLGFGWAEDVAAGRRPRMNPWPRVRTTPAGRAVPVQHAALPPAAAIRRRPGLAIALLAVVLTASLALALATGPTAQAIEPTIGVLPVAGPATAGPTTPSLTRYPLHQLIPATTFWIGAVAPQNPGGDDAQSLASAWDGHWSEHYGGCDGLGRPGVGCISDGRLRRAPDWFPTAIAPQENPYYVGLPYNDLASPKSTDRMRIPWAVDPGFAVHLHDRTVSFLKNRWVQVSGPTGTCYAQVEDSGPGLQDPDYVLGTGRPTGTSGINLSPALGRCIGLGADAGGGTVGWRFVDVPRPGPWARVITSRQVS
jgi:peptidoglycan/LPS O-acetylase OafA/YrhL